MICLPVLAVFGELLERDFFFERLVERGLDFLFDFAIVHYFKARKNSRRNERQAEKQVTAESAQRRSVAQNENDTGQAYKSADLARTSVHPITAYYFPSAIGNPIPTWSNLLPAMARKCVYRRKLLRNLP